MSQLFAWGGQSTGFSALASPRADLLQNGLVGSPCSPRAWQIILSFLQDIITCWDSFLHISVLIVMVYTLNHYALVSGYFFLSTSPVLPHPPVLPSHTPYFSSFLFRATGAESSVQIYCLWLKIQRKQEVSWANICKGIRNDHVFDL